MAGSGWFPAMGFTVLHTPGISRAWHYEFPDGSDLLVTNVDGYDLPETGGPYSATWISQQGELLDFVPFLRRTKNLHDYTRHLRRRVVREMSLPIQIRQTPAARN